MQRKSPNDSKRILKPSKSNKYIKHTKNSVLESSEQFHGDSLEENANKTFQIIKDALYHAKSDDLLNLLSEDQVSKDYISERILEIVKEFIESFIYKEKERLILNIQNLQKQNEYKESEIDDIFSKLENLKEEKLKVKEFTKKLSLKNKQLVTQCEEETNKRKKLEAKTNFEVNLTFIQKSQIETKLNQLNNIMQNIGNEKKLAQERNKKLEIQNVIKC